MTRLSPLQPGRYYHIYNRGWEGGNLFFEDRNYSYFWRLFTHYLHPFVEVYAYCLLRNHFHLLVRVREARLPGDGGQPPAAAITPRHMSPQFSNFYNAYAKAINKAYRRSGPVFAHRFQRKVVASRRYFRALVNYIHRNPQTHGFVGDFRQYPYSSYATVLSARRSQVQRQHVLEWFGSREALVADHAADGEVALLLDVVGDDAG